MNILVLIFLLTLYLFAEKFKYEFREAKLNVYVWRVIVNHRKYKFRKWLFAL